MPIMSRDCYFISTDKPMLGAIHEGNIITNQDEDDGIGGGP